MPLVIAPSTLDIITSLYSDCIIIDDIVQYYQIPAQVTKFLQDHYSLKLQDDNYMIVSYWTTPVPLLRIQIQIQCQSDREIQIYINGKTGQLHDIIISDANPTQTQIPLPIESTHSFVAYN